MSFLTPENITDSLRKSGNLENENIFGYSKLVIKRIIKFTTKLFNHYNSNLATYIDEQFDAIIREGLLPFIQNSSKRRLGDLIRKLISSNLLKALIYPMIDFPERLVKILTKRNIDYIQDFFNMILIYFRSNLDHLLLAFKETTSNEETNKYIYRVIISMKISMCHKIAWNKHMRPEVGAQIQTLDDHKIVSIFQEAILVHSLNVSSSISDSFVCNLPGCGDCLTILKEHDDYFFFTECKLAESQASRVLHSFNSNEVINFSLPITAVAAGLAAAGPAAAGPAAAGPAAAAGPQTHLLQRIEPIIKDRYLTSYLHNFTIEHNVYYFTLAFLQKNSNKTATEKRYFTTVITENDFDLICREFGYNIRQYLNARVRQNQLANLSLTALLQNTQAIGPMSWVDLSEGWAPDRFFDFLVTEKNKFFQKTSLLEKKFSLNNTNSLREARKARGRKRVIMNEKEKKNSERRELEEQKYRENERKEENFTKLTKKFGKLGLSSSPFEQSGPESKNGLNGLSVKLKNSSSIPSVSRQNSKLNHYPFGKPGNTWPGMHKFFVDMSTRASARGASANGASANGASANGDLTKRTSAKRTSANGASANEASVNGASANRVSARGASANEASVNGASANRVSARGASANGASANRVSARGASANGASAKRSIENMLNQLSVNGKQKKE
jgi:hypothetical protein